MPSQIKNTLNTLLSQSRSSGLGALVDTSTYTILDT